MPNPAGPLPTPTTSRPDTGRTTRPVSGTADPDDQGHTTGGGS